MRRDGADVVIVGGGVIGCALARELALRGAAVTVIERAEPGAEASGAAAGLLAPQAEGLARGPFFDLALESDPTLLEPLTVEDVVWSYQRLAGEASDDRPAGRRSQCEHGERFAWQRRAGLAVEEKTRERSPP